MKGVSGFGFDLIRGAKTLDLVKSAGFPAGKYLFAGVVDGRNIWANDLASSFSTLQALEAIVGKGIHALPLSPPLFQSRFLLNTQLNVFAVCP